MFVKCIYVYCSSNLFGKGTFLLLLMNTYFIKQPRFKHRFSADFWLKIFSCTFSVLLEMERIYHTFQWWNKVHLKTLCDFIVTQFSEVSRITSFEMIESFFSESLLIQKKKDKWQPTLTFHFIWNATLCHQSNYGATRQWYLMVLTWF